MDTRAGIGNQDSRRAAEPQRGDAKPRRGGQFTSKPLSAPKPGDRFYDAPVEEVMCLEAAAKHLRDLGYPANANQLWRMCRKGKLKYTVYRKSFYVTHSQLMTALEPEKELSTPAGRSALEAKLSRRPLGHRMAVSLLTARGLMPTPEQQAEALARAQAAERQAVNVSLEGRAHA